MFIVRKVVVQGVETGRKVSLHRAFLAGVTANCRWNSWKDYL